MANSIRIDKVFTYRGNPEVFSNRYHFDGSAPASSAEWDAIRAAFVALEKAMFTSACAITFVAGYTDDNAPAVYQYDYTLHGGNVNGTLTSFGTGYDQAPGDVAAWIRFGTGKTNSKNRPIYLRKYYHCIGHSLDAWSLNQRSAAGSLASALIAGVAVTGFSARKICDKDGDVPLGHAEPTYTTTRTLKRRGGSPL